MAASAAAWLDSLGQDAMFGASPVLRGSSLAVFDLGLFSSSMARDELMSIFFSTYCCNVILKAWSLFFTRRAMTSVTPNDLSKKKEEEEEVMASIFGM